jgi:hypothetical protein
MSVGVLEMLPIAGFALMTFLTIPLRRRPKLGDLLLASMLLTVRGRLGCMAHESSQDRNHQTCQKTHLK